MAPPASRDSTGSVASAGSTSRAARGGCESWREEASRQARAHLQRHARPRAWPPRVVTNHVCPSRRLDHTRRRRSWCSASTST